MFKIVQDPEVAAQPTLIMICDGSCSNVLVQPVQLGTQELTDTHNAFAVEASRQGWMVRFDKQLCPVHAKRYAEAVKMTQPRIHVVGSLALKN